MDEHDFNIAQLVYIHTSSISDFELDTLEIDEVFIIDKEILRKNFYSKDNQVKNFFFKIM
jgi:hypothetical protein